MMNFTEPMSSYLSQALIIAVPLLSAITLHELSHGWVAYRHGDNTAKSEGRLSLNPLKHLELFGSIIVPASTYFLLGGLVFGWAKPVPVNPNKLNHPNKDMALVALAGPASNLIMAIFWFILLRICSHTASPLMPEITYWQYILISMSTLGCWLNFILMAFNLFPLPPLDGSRILSALLPTKYQAQYEQLAPYGMLLIVIALATDIFPFALIKALGVNFFKFLGSF